MSTAPFYYQRVTDTGELNRFINNYRLVSGNELPAQYLTNAIVYQFYRGPRAIAGFILNTTEMNNLRYLSYLESDLQEQLLLEEDIKKEDCLEITGNYKIKQELSSTESRVYYTVMLSQAYQHAKRLRKKFLLGGSVIKAVKTIQQKLMDRVIYHGPIKTELLAKVKASKPLLKIYVIEIAQLPLRALYVIVKRYFINILKNSLKQSTNNLQKRVKLPSPPSDQLISGESKQAETDQSSPQFFRNTATS